MAKRKRVDGENHVSEPPSVPMSDAPPAKRTAAVLSQDTVAMLAAADRVVKHAAPSDTTLNTSVAQFVAQTLQMRGRKKKNAKAYMSTRAECSAAKSSLTELILTLCGKQPPRSKMATFKLLKDEARWPATTGSKFNYVQFCETSEYNRGFEADVLCEAISRVEMPRVYNRVKKATKTKPIDLDQAFAAEVSFILPKVRGTKVPSFELRETAQVKLTKEDGEFPDAPESLMNRVEERVRTSHEMSLQRLAATSRTAETKELLLPRQNELMGLLVSRGLASYVTTADVRRTGADGTEVVQTKVFTVQRKKKSAKKVTLNATWVKVYALPPCITSAGGFAAFEADKAKFLTVFKAHYMPMFTSRRDERVAEPGETLSMREDDPSKRGGAGAASGESGDGDAYEHDEDLLDGLYSE